jgi:hypothetical protein
MNTSHDNGKVLSMLSGIRISGTMLLILRGFCVMVLITMIVSTTMASIEQPIWSAGSFLEEPWGIAALLDAYYGFFFFYMWVLYKSPGFLPRLLWFIAIMLLGNMAMAVYFFLQTLKVKPGDPIEKLTLRESTNA